MFGFGMHPVFHVCVFDLISLRRKFAEEREVLLHKLAVDSSFINRIEHHVRSSTHQFFPLVRYDKQIAGWL